MTHALQHLPMRILAAFALIATGALAEGPPEWVARSDQNAQVLIDVLARFSPEAAGFWGVSGLDEKVFALPPDYTEQNIAATEEALALLRERRAAETDPAVLQDLDILIRSSEDSIESIRINEKHLLPYFDVPRIVFQGLRALLDDQVAAERRGAALVRLRRYAGLEEGYTPIVDQAKAYIRARFERPGLLGPFRGELEKDLANRARFVEGIGQLFDKYGLSGYEEALGALRQQLDGWETFVREELMTRARDDFRIPAAVYADNLKQFGVDMPVGELVSRAKVAFREIQNEMQALATLVAGERELPSTDYRDVIRELKKEQIVGEAILPHYEERIAALERLIEREKVVTLPQREMRIRLASAAESAAVPAPNMRPPRLLGNTGEMGEFVLPLRIPGEGGEGELEFDDFTYDAASWTLTVHEGRPGHELQFASIVEKGVSRARALFAFNSVNAEGWALYAEAEMKPHLPLEGQLVSLQHRLMRAARAFLDPGLQLGQVSREEALRVLKEDVVLSDAAALQEVERYTFWAPGQATAYFCGYTRLMELRTDVERVLAGEFDRRAFHDFVLAQGLLPPSLLRQAVMEEFVENRGT